MLALPTDQEVTNLARSLARRVTHTEVDVDDLMQEALWSLHKRLKKTPHPDNFWAFAKTVMLRSMQTYYSGGWRPSGARHDSTPTMSLDYVTTGCDPRQALDEELDLDQFFSTLEATCGPMARHVAENLISPTNYAYCYRLIEQSRCKAQARRNGAAVRGVQHIRVSHKQLRAALGLDRKQWKIVLREVRTFTTKWLSWTSINTSPTKQRVPD